MVGEIFVLEGAKSTEEFILVGVEGFMPFRCNLKVGTLHVVEQLGDVFLILGCICAGDDISELLNSRLHRWLDLVK